MELTLYHSLSQNLWSEFWNQSSRFTCLLVCPLLLHDRPRLCSFALLEGWFLHSNSLRLWFPAAASLWEPHPTVFDSLTLPIPLKEALHPCLFIWNIYSELFLVGPDCYNPRLEEEIANSPQTKLGPGSTLFFNRTLGWAIESYNCLAVRLWTISFLSLGQSGSLHQSRRDWIWWFSSSSWR